MTRNQIEYQRNVELKRANLASEKQTQVRDSETARANKAREAENFRTNTANEQIRQGTLAETARTNRANEQLKGYQIGVTDAHNAAMERLQASQNAELARSNLARELETNRANVARELEQERSNRANESLTQSETSRKQLNDLLQHDDRVADRTLQRELNKSRLESNESIANADRASRDRNALMHEIAETGRTSLRSIGSLAQQILRGTLGGLK